MKAIKRVIMAGSEDSCCVMEDTEFHLKTGSLPNKDRSESDILKKMVSSLEKRGVKPGTKLKITIEAVKMW